AHHVLRPSTSRCSSSLSSLPLSSLGLVRLLGLELGQQFVEPIEAAFPELAVGLQPRVSLCEWPREDSARSALRIAPSRDEPCLLQHLEVLRDGRLAHGER